METGIVEKIRETIENKDIDAFHYYSFKYLFKYATKLNMRNDNPELEQDILKVSKLITERFDNEPRIGFIGICNILGPDWCNEAMNSVVNRFINKEIASREEMDMMAQVAKDYAEGVKAYNKIMGYGD